ncbi:MAG: AAA domain-containing protein [Actinomycetota bacterium]
MTDVHASGPAVPEDGLLAALCRTYADLLRRQRTAATPFAQWSKATRRAHDFVWLGGRFDSEVFLLEQQPLTFGPTDPLYEAVHKMYGTAKLNPYEREVLYGFPYVIGRVRGKPVRGPLLTLSVEIDAEGDRLKIQPADEVVRFNSLPFRTDVDTASRDHSLARIMEATPALPLSADSLQGFARIVSRELPRVEIWSQLTGTLVEPPAEPKSGEFLAVIDQAALFVAPKTNYFLRSDLEDIAQKSPAEIGALRPLLGGAGDEEQVDFTVDEIDTAKLFFPFPANRAQRRVALLAADPTTHLVRIEGPPGTGKSLTIANLACHLAAEGRRVLITSQKDKALEVVDAKLRELGLAELPMTLLRHDRESKRVLLDRLDGIEKRRPRAEVEEHYARLGTELAAEAAEQLHDAEAYAQSLLWEDKVERAQRALEVASRLRRLPKRWRARRVLRAADKRAPETTDEIAVRVGTRREQLRRMALASLQLGLERGISGAKRGERQVVREMQDILKRDQRSHRNFSLFDRLKQQGETARKLLRILPVWIVSPDDAARLFPCEPGLFDVVIIDEASQVDLPSILPMAYRGEKVLIFGDTKQMQSKRFAFMSRNVALEAWQQFGMDRLDPDQRPIPSRGHCSGWRQFTRRRSAYLMSTSARFRRSSSFRTDAGIGTRFGS